MKNFLKFFILTILVTFNNGDTTLFTQAESFCDTGNAYVLFNNTRVCFDSTEQNVVAVIKKEDIKSIEVLNDK